ncbi:MAG TPA: LysR family transcriptional regulator, partial [Polyangiaceae bacterium]|nr:LysR family transcriptional regulator [Polyangiaceae bacterium]
MGAKQPSSLTVNDLPLVLALARARTLAGAAERLELDVSTVFRRLNALEKRLRVRLFDRSPRGYQLTAAGERASAAAERIETEVHSLDREITGRDQQLSGTLRITASETLSHAVLPKLFANFHAQHPHIQLVLSIENRVLDLSRREADVALRTRRPTDDALFGRKIANIAWALYGPASGARAIARVGRRFNFSHRAVVGWDEPGARIAASEWVSQNVPAGQIVYRSNSLVNQLMAVRAGVGVALLPCYLADPEKEVRRLSGPLPEVSGELWIVTHKDLKETA